MTAAMTAMAERTTKSNDAIKALLTDEQKKKMETLTAGAAELKTKLGIGQRQPGQQGQRGGGNAGGVYTPGAQSWQPGQGQNAPSPAQRPGNFPRGNAN